MQNLSVIVSYFPKAKIYYAKIVKSQERENYWKMTWEAQGGIVVSGSTYYKENRERAYKNLKETLVKEIKNKYGSA